MTAQTIETPAAQFAGASVEIAPKVLHHLLSSAAHCAAKAADRTPLLESVHIEADEDGITVTATDRYVLARGFAPVEEASAPISATVRVSDLKRIVSMLAPMTRGYVSPAVPVFVDLLPGGELLTVSRLSESVTVQVLDMSYPKVDPILELREPVGGEWLFDPSRLGSLAAMTKGHKVSARMQRDARRMLSASWTVLIGTVDVDWQWRGMGLSDSATSGR